jgi:hypothetical protein
MTTTGTLQDLHAFQQQTFRKKKKLAKQTESYLCPMHFSTSTTAFGINKEVQRSNIYFMLHTLFLARTVTLWVHLQSLYFVRETV